MAGGRDIKRDTLTTRRAQAGRNRAAQAERDAALTAAEGPSPARRHRRDQLPGQSSSGVLIRRGATGRFARATPEEYAEAKAAQQQEWEERKEREQQEYEKRQREKRQKQEEQRSRVFGRKMMRRHVEDKMLREEPEDK